jgi:Icc-related predicted phosphoesterase
LWKHRQYTPLGYPYADDKAFSEDVYQLEQNCIAFSNQHASADTSLQWIWLTHCGPAGLSTTDANLKPYDPASRIQSGSHALYKLIAEHSKPDDGMDLLMNLHGHTHASWGQVQVGSTHGESMMSTIQDEKFTLHTLVINPGSLAEKRYAILKLTRDTAGTGRWYLTSVEFILAQS